MGARRFGRFIERDDTIPVFVGWALSVVIGIGIGLFLGLSTFARRYFLASVELLRPLPGIGFLPVARRPDVQDPLPGR